MTPAKTIRILLALDGSAHASRAAQYVAQRAVRLTDTEVTVIHVIPGPPPPHAVSLGANETVTDIRLQLQAAGVPSALNVVQGTPATRIAEIAQKDGYDEIVIGSRGAGAIEGLALGSVAYKVIHLATCPVTVIPNPFGATELETEDDGATHRILLAVDGSRHATRAVDYVCGLRQTKVPVEVRLLNVQRSIASAQISRHIPRQAIESYLRDEGEAVIRPAAQALERAGIAFVPQVLIGHVAEGIVREALEAGCTRIVMGTRGMGTLAGMALGSTAMNVLHQSEIPVTLVK
jgi:nucleotide-binding universal stress UspA family protein